MFQITLKEKNISPDWAQWVGGIHWEATIRAMVASWLVKYANTHEGAYAEGSDQVYKRVADIFSKVSSAWGRHKNYWAPKLRDETKMINKCCAIVFRDFDTDFDEACSIINELAYN
jgi:hypothetical protein